MEGELKSGERYVECPHLVLQERTKMCVGELFQQVPSALQSFTHTYFFQRCNF